MVGEAGRSWQGIEESSTLLNITTSPRDSVPPTPHNLTLGSLFFFTVFGNIFRPPLPSPSQLSNSRSEKTKVITHLQIFFLGSDNDSSFRARWRPRRWLGDRNGSHVSRRKVVGCQSSTSTWALSGGFAARSSTHCYTSIMGPFIAAVSCSILWSNLIFFVTPDAFFTTLSELVKLVWFGGSWTWLFLMAMRNSFEAE